jgi:hypothetical protein
VAPPRSTTGVFTVNASSTLFLGQAALSNLTVTRAANPVIRVTGTGGLDMTMMMIVMMMMRRRRTMTTTTMTTTTITVIILNKTRHHPP